MKPANVFPAKTYQERCGFSPSSSANLLILGHSSLFILESELSTTLGCKEKTIRARLKKLPATFGPFKLEKALQVREKLQAYGSVSLRILSIAKKAAKEVAQDNLSPSDVLSFLSFAPNKKIRKLVAKNPNTSLQTLLELANEFLSEVLQNPAWTLAFLENPSWIQSVSSQSLRFFLLQSRVPVSLLKEASRHPESSIQEIALSHPEFPADDLESFLQEGEYYRVLAIVKNPNCPKNLLERIALNQDKYTSGIFFNRLPGFLAKHSHSSPTVIRLLLTNSDISVREIASTHSNCLEEELEFLWRAGARENLHFFSKKRLDPFFSFEELQELIKRGSFGRQLAANYPDCPISLLEQLASDPDRDVRREVASRDGCPSFLLEKLSLDQDKFVRSKVANSGSCSIKLLRKLALDQEEYVWSSVVKNPRCPPDVLDKLHSLVKDDQVWYLALNPNCSIKLLTLLAKHKEKVTRDFVAIHRKCPQETLVTLSRDLASRVRCSAVSHPNFPKPLLASFASSRDKKIRKSVADNPKCPLKVLKILAMDPSVTVREFAASNSRCSVPLLKTLALDKKTRVRESVAWHSKTPRKILSYLANDKKVKVRVSVARNPKTPAKSLVQLSKDSEEQVRGYAAKNPNFPVKKLSKFIQKFPALRKSISSHPKCSSKLIDQLLQDPDKFVRQAARESVVYRKRAKQKDNRKL